jgi:hypothetical protein
VGTGDGPEEHRGTHFDTPSLLGLYAAVSYLHDGRAASLAEVLTIHNAEDRHGVTSHLSERDTEDLVAFLRSLPPDVVFSGEGPAAVKSLRPEGHHEETDDAKRGVEDMRSRIDEMRREIEQLRRDLDQLRDQLGH